jgi:beta-N-acetylhexosaminidase
MELARAVIESGTPVVLAVFGNPYAAMDLPEPDALLIAYDPTRRSATAAVNVMMGRKPATGRLPVSIPGRYVLGSRAVGRFDRSPSSFSLQEDFN